MTEQPKVLIVDDEERFRNTMCKLITSRGLTATTAGGGPEALEKLKAADCDVIILDVRMPEMSGVEVLAQIRKINPEVEVIIMTGYASVDTAEQIMKLGAFDYILKPCDIDKLMEKIDAAFERKTQRKELAARPQGRE